MMIKNIMFITIRISIMLIIAIILIIFGKGNEEYQEIDGKKLYYSDRKIIEEFYES